MHELVENFDPASVLREARVPSMSGRSSRSAKVTAVGDVSSHLIRLSKLACKSSGAFWKTCRSCSGVITASRATPKRAASGTGPT